MGKDRTGFRGAKYNPSNSGEAGTLMGSSQASGFIGFSAFTSNFSNATDPDYYQVEPEYKVLLKKLQKKDSISRIKGLEELIVLFNKINVESSEFSASSISSLMNAWEFMYKRLVNDDDRQVRDLSNQCLGSIGSRIGKYLGPHVKSLLGPWLFAICDQQDQSTSNSALLAFNNIFPEKKRKDVFKFGHDEALTYLCENLQETAQTIGDSKSVHQDILQERYERCISNSLLAIEYLINSTSVTTTTTNDTTTSTTTSDNTEIYEKIFESQFFSFFQSKSSNIRKTAYRVLATIIKKVPGYVDKNFKDFSSKVLGLFSEKDSSTHLYMWDAIISFLKQYKEKAWLNVDVRKHVLPRLWSFLRSGCYGSYELSYPSILPLLTFIPQSVIGDGTAFFKEFFTNLEKGLQAIDSSTVRNNTSNSSADNKPSMLLLSCYLECLIYSIKKWGGNNSEINSYLIDTLLSSLYQNYFKFEVSPFNDNRLFIDKLLETTNKISTISPNIDSIFKSLSSDIFTTLITPTPIIEVEQATTTTTTPPSSTTPITKKEEKVILPITNETLFSRLNSFLTVLKVNKIQESNQTGTQEFIKKLFNCSSENLKNHQEISIKVMDIVLVNFKIDSILSNDSNEIKSFLNDTVISTFNNIGSGSDSDSINGLVKSLISISITLLSSDSLSSDEIKQCWSNILTVFVYQRNSEQQLINLINGCKLDRSLYLTNSILDKVIDQVCQTDEIPSIEKVSLISSLLLKDGEFSPIISVQSIEKLINWVLVKLSELMDTIQMNLLMEFNIDYLVELSKLIFKISTVTIIGKSDKLYEQWTKFVIEINHRSNLSTMYGKVVSDIESVLFNSSFTLSPVISNSILSILIDYVNNSNNNNISNTNIINLTYLSNCAIKLIKNNFDNTYSTLLNQFSKNTLISNSINQIQISWFRYIRITPFYLTSDTGVGSGSECNIKSTNQLFKILVFNFKILESFGWNQFIKHSSSENIKTMLINLLFLNGDNKYPTSNQNEIGQFIENNSEILICKFVESLFGSVNNGAEIFNSQWFTEIIESSKSNGIYLIILKLFVDYISNNQEISSDTQQQQLKNTIIEKLLPKVGDQVESKHQLNLIQVLLPILPNETILKLKSNVVEKLVALTSSIPNSFSNVSIQLSLLTSILQLQRDGITKSDYSNLLHVLSMIQQWLSKLKSPLFKDDKSTLDSFTSELECSQLNLILLIVNYSTSKQEYLSSNQSSLVQSLLSVWLLPLTSSPSTSSNNNQQQYKKLVNYQSLKIFNQIISNDSLKYIVPGGDQFLIDHSILVLNKWLDQIGNADLGFSSDSSIIFELFSNTFDKMSTDIKYKISLTRLDALISLLYCEHTNIQKITYNLLESYFINDNTQLIKSFILNSNETINNNNNNNNNDESQEDQIEYIVFSGEFEKILLDFENTWKPMKKDKESTVVNSKCLGQLLLWNLVMKNYSTLDLSRRSVLNGWLNKDNKVSQLLNQIFTYAKKDESPNSNFNQFPWNNEIDMISYRSLQSLCSHCIYSLVNYLPNMVRRWADDCSTNSKVNQQIQNYIVRYVSPLIIQNEINRVNSYSREHNDECFSIKGSTSSKEVTAGYEKDEMTISLVLSIPDTYPLRVPTVEFSKRIGVSESQWRQWLLSMTSLVLTQDGSVLDACLLWKNALDKHFDGVEVCLICYSIFQGGTIPKFQCRTCKNKFHAGCIYKWFVTSCKNNCPLCQTEIAH